MEPSDSVTVNVGDSQEFLLSLDFVSADGTPKKINLSDWEITLTVLAWNGATLTPTLVKTEVDGVTVSDDGYSAIGLIPADEMPRAGRYKVIARFVKGDQTASRAFAMVVQPL